MSRIAGKISRFQSVWFQICICGGVKGLWSHPRFGKLFDRTTRYAIQLSATEPRGAILKRTTEDVVAFLSPDSPDCRGRPPGNISGSNRSSLTDRLYTTEMAFADLGHVLLSD